MSDFLRQYLEGGPTTTSDYIDTSAKKKTKKKKKRAEGDVPAKKRRGALQIVDVDFDTKVDAPAEDDVPSDDEEMPVVEIDRRLEEEIALKEAEERRRNRSLDPNEFGTWVDVGGPGSPKRESNTHMSPPRRGTSDGSLSPPRRRRHDSDDEGDLSPPRRRAEPDGDSSPPRRTFRHDSDGDLSPPRTRTQRSKQDEDLSPPRRRATARHDSDSDLSPPRNRVRHDSPPRRSAPRAASPAGDDDGDLSPPRKRAKRHDSPSPPRHSSTAATPAAPVGGLVMARDVVAEAQARKIRESEAMKSRDAESMGKGASTVYRDRHGRKLEMLNQMMRQQQGILVDPEEDQMEWGKGKVDKVDQEKEERRRREEAGAAYKGYSALTDERVNQIKLDQERWGDPLAGLVPKKKKSDDNARKRPEWTKPFPPNRFNIKPGHLWDGVDRSNGFERQYFERQNTAQARKVEAYHLSAADM